MATLYQVLSALQQQISVATAGLPAVGGGLLNVMVGIDWPSIKVLQAGVKNGSAIITIFDRKMSRNTTRWTPIALSQTVTPATLTTSASGVIPPLGSGLITLGGPVTNGDAVSCVLTNNSALPTGTPTAATIVVGTGADTPATMAYRLTLAISEEPTLSTWVTAVQTGQFVTLTSLISHPIGLASYAGNGGTQITEIGRRERELQVVVWTASPEDRDTVGNVVETMLASMEAFVGAYPGGLIFSDGTSGRVTVRNDFLLDDATLAGGAYRRDVLLCVDYPVTTQNALYAVLAAIPQYSDRFFTLDQSELGGGDVLA